jgi:hypothetical protein
VKRLKDINKNEIIKNESMKKYFSLLMLGLLVWSCGSTQDLGGIFKAVTDKVTGPTGEEIGMGLKEALNNGVGEAVGFLSNENGYLESAYKILLPEEAQKVAQKLRGIPGFSDFEANLVEKLNRAAEGAAAKASPIFISAIKQMTFQDAYQILTGEHDAATRYLEKTTYDQLYGEFQPVVITSLDEVNAREYWKKAADTYNKIPFVGQKVNPELDDYVTSKALVGLFSLIEQKEEGIRENPVERTSELLKKVFKVQDPGN